MSSTVEIAINIRPFHVDIPDEALEDLRREARALFGQSAAAAAVDSAPAGMRG